MKVPSLITIFVVFALAKDVWCNQNDGNDEQIVGGYSDTVQNNPYIVSLLLEKKNKAEYNCGGSIISEYYILTAAHCMEGIVKATIRAGSSESGRGGLQYTSAQIILHPSYNSNNVDNDVAIIRTTKPILLDGTNTKAAKLPKQEYVVSPGTNIKVSGWGKTVENGNQSPTLLSVVVQAVPNDVCAQQTGLPITTCKICAGVAEGGKGPCKGDSGGPAVVSQTKELVGIVSHGIGCARPNNPGVYTRVACAGVRSWIQRITGV